MLIGVKDIQDIRSVANNIDPKKVEIYIAEAEMLDLIPIIGMELYNRLESGEGVIVVGIDEFGVPQLLADEEGNPIVEMENRTTAEELMLNGGKFFGRCCGKLQRIDGLKKALAYFAYARLVRNHQVAVTPFGVVSKMGDDSSPTDARTVAATANDARNIGLAIVERCMRYWAMVEKIYCFSVARNPFKSNGKRRFIAIGE